MQEKTVAIYLDFENLAISALEAYRGIEMPLRIAPLVDFAESKGNLKVKKVYADWSKKKFSQYQKELLLQGFELIHLPETNLFGKNGSDMRLVIDVMEHMYSEHRPDVILIGSGDSDFIPLIQHIQNRHAEVVLLSFEHSVSNLIKQYCSDFQSLKKLIGDRAHDKLLPASSSTHLPRRHPSANHRKGKAFLERYIEQRGDASSVISLSELKQDILKFDPQFSEEEYGHLKFKKFLKAYRGDVIEKIEKRDKQWWVELKAAKQSPEKKTASPAIKDSTAFKSARLLVKRLIATRKQSNPLPMARFKPLLMKLDPSFSEKKLGYRYFKQFAEDLVGDLIEKITEEGFTLYVHFKEEVPLRQHHIKPPPLPTTNGHVAEATTPPSLGAKKTAQTVKKEAKTYLEADLLYMPTLALRAEIARNMLMAHADFDCLTLAEMQSYLISHASQLQDKRLFEKYVHLLLQNDLFDIVKKSQQPALISYHIKKHVTQEEQIDEIYIEAVGKALQKRFPSLRSRDIVDLLFAFPKTDKIQ